jgi:dTMP kinase
VARSRLITIEGLDGAGKTTLARTLRHELATRASGMRRVELLREPGGVEVSERIRALVKDPALRPAARTEALLYAAARAQLVEERVRPLLEEGATVLLDRFVDSSLAYQGAGRALGIEQVRAINLFATGGLEADRTLLLRISPAVGRARQLERAQTQSDGAQGGQTQSGGTQGAGTQGGGVRGLDRMEREGEDFYAAIADAYEQLAREAPQRIRVLDASQPPECVLADALAALEDLL